MIPRIRRSSFLIGVVAVALGGRFQNSGAQQVSTYGSSGLFVGGMNNSLCPDGGTLLPGPNNGSVHCTIIPGVVGDGEWSATVGGPLRLRASLSLSGANVPFAVMQTMAQFNDALLFTGSDLPAAVVFTLHESGVITGSANTPDGENMLSSELFGGNTCEQAPTVYLLGVFSTSRNVLCSIADGRLDFGYLWVGQAMVDRTDGNDPGPYDLSGTASVDAWNTGLITGVTFLDASGTDISPSVQFSSASGAIYALNAAVIATPEPSSILLLATGLVALVAAGVRPGRRAGPRR